MYLPVEHYIIFLNNNSKLSEVIVLRLFGKFKSIKEMQITMMRN